MNDYETILILNPTLEEENVNEVIEKIKSVIAENGSVADMEIWGKRKLAYPIKKFNEGYYILINFSSSPKFIEELNRIYDITEEIIKHIIVKKD